MFLLPSVQTGSRRTGRQVGTVVILHHYLCPVLLPKRSNLPRSAGIKILTFVSRTPAPAVFWSQENGARMGALARPIFLAQTAGQSAIILSYVDRLDGELRFYLIDFVGNASVSGERLTNWVSGTEALGYGRRWSMTSVLGISPHRKASRRPFLSGNAWRRELAHGRTQAL